MRSRRPQTVEPTGAKKSRNPAGGTTGKVLKRTKKPRIGRLELLLPRLLAHNLSILNEPPLAMFRDTHMGPSSPTSVRWSTRVRKLLDRDCDAIAAPA